MADCPTCEYHKKRAQIWRDEVYKLAGHPLPRKEKSMTQDEIIELAREAGLLVIGTSNGGDAVYTWPAGITEELETFAKLVAEKEREACAKICEDMSGPIEIYNPNYTHYIDCAKAIRARGQA